MLVRVTAITPEVVKSLAEATPEIRKDLALAEANRILLDVHDNYEDSRAAGESLREAAAKLNLDVVTVEAIDRAALRPDGTVIGDLPQSKELLDAAFEAEAGIENPAVNVGSTGYVFYEIEGITPARDRTLDEVKAKVVADWKEAESEKRLAAKAADLEKRLKDGAPLDTLATELKLEKQTKRGLKREADDADFGRAGVAAIFGVAEGGTGLVAAPTGDAQIVFKVTEVFEPAGADANSVPGRRAKILRVRHGRRPARPAGRQAAGRIRRDGQPRGDRPGAGVLGGGRIGAMATLKEHIAKVASGKPLSFEEAREAFDIIMSGEATPGQIGGFLMALRVRGETVDEISGAVATMRDKMLRVEAPDGAIDIVGTGGDGSHSLNISTASAFVIAGAGVPVAKHGNRGLSSQTGAADVLTALGVKIDLPPEAIGLCVAEAGVGFMFAPAHHPAMRHVGPTRAELGTRTIFNLLGPLSNPAGVKRQMVGVFAPEWIEPVAETLKALGTERAWVAHGDGYDEITTTGETRSRNSPTARCASSR